MPEHRRRLVNKVSFCSEHAKKAEKIVATSGRCTCSGRRIETTTATQELRVESHIGSGAQSSCGGGKQRVQRSITVEVVPPRGESTTKSSVLLKKLLGRCLDLRGKDEARDTGDLWGYRSSLDKACEPVWVDDNIVVGNG